MQAPHPLPPEIDPANLPRHIAVIMDGNGRWAKKNSLKVALGHRAGTENLREIIRNCSDIGVEALTLYAFSTENWNRSKTEVDALMQLILDFFHSEIDELDEKGVRILILGDKSGLPEPQRLVLEQAEERTAKNTGLSLNIAVNYGGRAEIVRAAQLLAAQVAAGERTVESIDEDAIADHLYTKGLPEVDLLIRTSGELRLSNFLLWELAYSEIYVTDVLWPDFGEEELKKAVAAYSKRERRFGGRIK